MNTLIKQSSLAFLLACALGCSKDNRQPTNFPDLEHRVDSVVQTHLDSNRIAGLTIAVAKGDSILLHKSYGYADLGLRVASPRNTVYGIGSMTKQFTAVAILQFVEQNKLKLDDDMKDYVSFDTGGKNVTIRQLLSHSSGIMDFAALPDFEILARLPLGSDSILGLVEQKKFDFNPGQGVLYSNTGYHLLGLIVQKVSGLSYDEYLRINFFQKLGMQNSAVCHEQTVVENQAHGYRYNKSLGNAPYLDHQWTFATGSICSTAEDIIKWNQALHGGKLLSADMYQELITPAILADATTTRYAKGLTVWESHDQKVISHGGKLFGFSSEGRYFPKEHLTFVTLMNTLGPVTPEEINDVAINAVLGRPTEVHRATAKDVAKYCGIYKGYGKGNKTTVTVTLTDSVLTTQFGTGRLRKLKYRGDGSWGHDRDIYYFISEGNKTTGLRVDRVYDYYVLKRE